MVGDVQWDRPGPGTWELDSSHFLAPGPIVRSVMERCLPNGFSGAFAEFGAPLKTMEIRWIRGRMYRRLVPLVGGSRDLKPPPAAVLKVLTRLHPTFRRNERLAGRTFADKLMRGELERWEREWKPALVRKNLAFTEKDVAGLDDTALVRHLHALEAHILETGALHFRLHVADMGPLGDLMVHLEDWGLERGDTFLALVAASPATREPAAQLRAIADALRDAGIDPTSVESLGDVRAVPIAAKALEDYLRFHGWRLTGYDVEDRALVEVPNVIVGAIRAAASRPPHDDDSDTALQELRARVPAEHRAEFDELVDDARLSYNLRDENGPLTWEWPAGLLRRALIECGARLRRAGRVKDEQHVFELTVSEIDSLLLQGEGPSVEEITGRAGERSEWLTLDAPARLGPEEAPPPVDAMPPNLGRMTRLILTVVDTLEAIKGGRALHGLGIGTEAYVGRARVAHDAIEALETVEPGDIIVTPFTAPTYNAVLAMAGGLVTEEGGLLCHAAVIARELGIPAVIGAEDAMKTIPDGATIEVDPVAGEVRLLTNAQ